MAYIVFPLLSLCTAFIFALFMHWYFGLRTSFFYSKVGSIEKGATHVLIEGLSGNKEVHSLKPVSYKTTKKTMFEYRFISFEYQSVGEFFKPVVFNVMMS
mmetsp:Transcript_36061/g.55382  ORF Transcript_36061/g.55382 Transcript_36061/m.55382 type:complete len:100 (-) Transcript_36061:3150-3449(-)